MDVLVVGAGLAGLTAAVDLSTAGRSVTVVEVRERVGGRLLTVEPEGLGEGARFDLGATWLWGDQPEVAALAADLGIAAFPQFADGRAMVEEAAETPPAPAEVPPSGPAELRLVGGAQQLCERLASRLPDEAVVLGTSVTAIATEEDRLAVSMVGPDGEARREHPSFVVVAMPPRLVLERIDFSPPLPDDLVRVMKATTTWMATAVKCVAVYDTAFWRHAGLSGTAFSPLGPLREVHDACTHDGAAAALWGFVAGDDDFRAIDPGERARLVLAHLARLFGTDSGDPAAYFERDWSADPNTADDEWWWVEGEPLAYGHPALAQPVAGGRVVLAGTETDGVAGGHMEGAVRSGRRAANLVLRGVRGSVATD